MSMLTYEEIENFCAEHNYDVRISGYGRWIDQKCTPDVLWSIADFVLDYISAGHTCFKVSDIWQSSYAKQTIAETYSKPNTDEKTAENEYDKVFSQPLCLFCYAGILSDNTKSKHHIYTLEKPDILEFIAKNDMNALRFLCCYIEKVLKDSGLFPVFEDFFENQDNFHFNKMKQEFANFCHKYTNIKGVYEPNRIFTKVLNPLAYKYKKKGAAHGRMSKDIINRADMMYNRDNFRDVYKNKPKGVSRQEWLKHHPEIDIREGFFVQQMAVTKKLLQKFIKNNRNNQSELTYFIQGFDDNEAPVQMHHIFPKSEFPELMAYPENLMPLTPNQHFLFAHPSNNTQVVDPNAQKELLIAKAYSIKKNLSGEDDEVVYSFANFAHVLATGWGDEAVKEIDENDYSGILHVINYHYISFDGLDESEE